MLRLFSSLRTAFFVYKPLSSSGILYQAIYNFKAFYLITKGYIAHVSKIKQLTNMKKYLILIFLATTFLWSCGNQTNEQTDNTSNIVNTKTPKENTNTSNNKEDGDSQGTDSDNQKPDETTTKVVNVVKSYFGNLTTGNYRAAAYDNFAASVDQWITMKNTNPKAIAAEAKRFLSTKKNVKYTPNLAGIVFKNNKARVVVRQEWKGYDTTLEVWLMLDKDTKIVSYKEGKIFKMKTVKPSAMEDYLTQTKTLSYPITVSSQQYDSFKNMGKSGLNLLIKDAIDGENFQNIGYFKVNADLIGILYVRGYRSSQSIVLDIYNRKSGKAISSEVVGFMGGGHVVSGYDQSCVTTIEPNGNITNNWTTVSTAADGSTQTESGVARYQITPNGQIIRA